VTKKYTKILTAAASSWWYTIVHRTALPSFVSLFKFLTVLGFELRASKISTIWGPSPAQFASGVLHKVSHFHPWEGLHCDESLAQVACNTMLSPSVEMRGFANFLSRLALNCDPSNLCLLCSWDTHVSCHAQQVFWLFKTQKQILSNTIPSYTTSDIPCEQIKFLQIQEQTNLSCFISHILKQLLALLKLFRIWRDSNSLFLAVLNCLYLLAIFLLEMESCY
jgi:hypothetical protein